jgi:hypothetical protein
VVIEENMKLNVFSCIGYILMILLVTSVDAFTLDESIEVNNKNANDSGFLYSRTDSPGINGMILGVGNQSYHEKINTDPENSIFVSSYNLSSQLPTGKSKVLAQSLRIGEKNGTAEYIDPNAKSIHQNRYSARMDSINGLSHFINLRTNGSIEANNAIVHNSGSKTVSTSYMIKTNDGNVAEGITILEGGRHPKYVVERNVVGAAKIKSNLSDSESNEVVSDQDLLLNKVEAVNMVTQTGKISYLIPMNEVDIENERGHLRFNVSNGSIKAAGIGLPRGGINISVSEDPLTNAIDQYDPVAQEASEAVAIVSKAINYKGITYITPQEKPEYDTSVPATNLSNETNQSNLSATNVSKALDYEGITFITPVVNFGDNPEEYMKSNLPNETNISNLSAINSSEKADIKLTIKQSGCGGSSCPYTGSSLAEKSSEKNSTSSLQSLNKSNQMQNQTPIAEPLTNSTMPEPGQNRSLTRGKTTFIMGDTDLPPPVPCVKQYVGLNAAPIGPPCAVKIGRGMGGVQY